MPDLSKPSSGRQSGSPGPIRLTPGHAWLVRRLYLPLGLMVFVAIFWVFGELATPVFVVGIVLGAIGATPALLVLLAARVGATFDAEGVQVRGLPKVPWSEVEIIKIRAQGPNRMVAVHPRETEQFLEGLDKRALQMATYRQQIVGTPFVIDRTIYCSIPDTDLDEAIRAWTGSRHGLSTRRVLGEPRSVLTGPPTEPWLDVEPTQRSSTWLRRLLAFGAFGALLMWAYFSTTNISLALTFSVLTVVLFFSYLASRARSFDQFPVARLTTTGLDYRVLATVSFDLFIPWDRVERVRILHIPKGPVAENTEDLPEGTAVLSFDLVDDTDLEQLPHDLRLGLALTEGTMPGHFIVQLSEYGGHDVPQIDQFIVDATGGRLALG